MSTYASGFPVPGPEEEVGVCPEPTTDEVLVMIGSGGLDVAYADPGLRLGTAAGGFGGGKGVWRGTGGEET